MWSEVGKSALSYVPLATLVLGAVTTWWVQGGLAARRRKAATELLVLWKDVPDEAAWQDERLSVERRLRRALTAVGAAAPTPRGSSVRTLRLENMQALGLPFAGLVTALASLDVGPDVALAAAALTGALGVASSVAWRVVAERRRSVRQQRSTRPVWVRPPTRGPG